MRDFIRISRETARDGQETGDCAGYSLLLLERGGTLRTPGGSTQTLQGDTLCLFLPHEPLQFSASDGKEALVLRFSLTVMAHPFLSPLLASLSEAPRIWYEDAEKTPFFHTVMRDMLMIREGEAHAEQLLFAKLLELLATLSPAKGQEQVGKHQAQKDLSEAVISYVNAHLGESISLDDIAAALFVSKYHMCHVFKKQTGLSVGEAVLRRKVAYADHLLASGIPAQRVSELVGFNYYSAFFRIYKRIKGHSPQSFRDLEK